MNECILSNDMTLLAENFYKIIEVNLAENTYYVVKVNEKEKVPYNDIMYWANEVVAAGLICEDDIDDFLDFFNSFKNIEKFSKKQIFFYRRLIDGEWSLVCTEVVPMSNFTKDDPVVLVLVRKVDDYINAYIEWELKDEDKFW